MPTSPRGHILWLEHVETLKPVFSGRDVGGTMKTIGLIVVALAIAFALFKVGAHFEQIAFDRCIVEGTRKVNEAYAKARGVYEDQRRKWIDNLGWATKGRGDLSDAALTPPRKSQTITG